MLDYIIKNGKIVDGLGTSFFIGDLGIKDGIIAYIGRFEEDALHIIDANGNVIAPGFIDSHTHSDFVVFNREMEEIRIRQGVTTEVFGNCGFSPVPVYKDNEAELLSYIEPIMGRKAHEFIWQTFEEYIECLDKLKLYNNIATLAGNGSLRIAIKGFRQGKTSKSEIIQIKLLLENALETGARGLSAGLIYYPECCYSAEEMIKICQVLKKYKRIFSIHLRGEARNLEKAIEEALFISEKAEVPLNISHLKAVGKENWNGKIDRVLECLDRSESRGINVTCDVYPYTAGATSLSALLPPWSRQGGVTGILNRIRNDRDKTKIMNELCKNNSKWDNLAYFTGWENITISSVSSYINRNFVGMKVKDIAQEMGISCEECALNLILEEECKISIIVEGMSEDDVKKVLVWDKSIVVSDSVFPAVGLLHPRVYGSIARLFSRYVRELKILTLENAVRKLTSLPALRYGLGRRGRLEKDYIADIVIFDPDKISDTSTYKSPCRYPVGIDTVFVGGALSLFNGVTTGSKTGKLLK